MKKLLSVADAYIAHMNWKDLALVKLCLCAAGVLLGLSAPKRWRKWGGSGRSGRVCGYLSAPDAQIPSPSRGGDAETIREVHKWVMRNAFS